MAHSYTWHMKKRAREMATLYYELERMVERGELVKVRENKYALPEPEQKKIRELMAQATAQK